MWGGSQELKKIAWVKWDVICLPKEDGGLGIKDISKFNAALMGRRIWALSSNQNQLWARILTSKYGMVYFFMTYNLKCNFIDFISGQKNEAKGTVS